jgi:mono/diheme cytochrome c family protein
MRNASLAFLVLTTTLSLSTAAFAQPEKTDAQAAKTDLGKKEYELQCAVCHGMDAKGDGVFNQVLKIVPPDLTVLATKNGGVFPAERISSVIDGRVEIASHGSRDMPIWGNRYAVDAAKHFPDFPYGEEGYIRARVIQLMDYLYRIQQK